MINNEIINNQIQEGNVYWCHIDGENHIQNGDRPCVIIQNDIGNIHSPNVIVFPLTASIKKLSQPTHVLLPSKKTGMPQTSMVLCETPMTLPKEKVQGYITSLTDEYMSKIASAALVSMPFLKYLQGVSGGGSNE